MSFDKAMSKSVKIDFNTVCGIIPKRDENGNKGSFGTALLFCGSCGMAGAAVLSVSAALRSGCGLVKCVLPDCIYPIAASRAPEAVFIPVMHQNCPGIPAEFAEKAIGLSKKATAVLAGCGMGNTADTSYIIKQLIKEFKGTLIIDADGINSIAGCIDILKESKGEVILTPHPKEFSRISGLSVEEIQADRENSASRFASEYGCTLVLKGRGTVVADKYGDVFINTSGGSGLAKGGSGDALAGIMVSLAAQGIPAVQSAVAAVYIHGAAGDIASERFSVHAVLPSDVILSLPDVFLKIEEKE